LSKKRLQLNVNKTKAILIRGIRKKVAEGDFKIKFRDENLEVVSEIKYLEVIIDRNLNFAAHVDYIGKKIGAKLGVLRRVSKDITPNMRCIVYKSVVAPLFEYCASVLIGVDKTNLQFAKVAK